MPLALSLGMCPALLPAEGFVAFKAQHYVEEDGRIEVNSLYKMADGRVAKNWLLSAETVYNTISGATPTGELADDESSDAPTAEISDTRRALSLNVTYEGKTWTFDSGLSRGKEDDYSSTSGSLKATRSLNQDNTSIGVGYAYTADRIFPFSTTERKRTHDAILSFTQILDRQTTLGVNLAISSASGFLNDPYKSIEQIVEIRPGRYSKRIYKENRPDERERWILYSQLNHRVEKVDGALEVSYRYSSDDWEIDAHTFGLTWFQNLSDRLILQFSGRYLVQSEAFFYRLSLTGSGIDPEQIDPGKGEGPYYAPDHRLSEMETVNLGSKLRLEITPDIAIDLGYERYTTNGRDGLTPNSVYSQANVYTLGGQWTF
jgi:hypothetical protein